MHSLLSPTVLAYIPVVLVTAGVAGYQIYLQYYKPAPVAATLPPSVIELLQAVDELALEFMRDPGTTGLEDATRKAFLDVVTAKTLARRGTGT